MQCGAGCVKCDSSSSCSECAKGFIFDNGSCSKKCPVNNYELNGKCFECEDKDCINCLSEDKGKTCVRCKAGKILYNGKCKDECPEGFYANGADAPVCKECSDNCTKCIWDESSKKDQCQTCEEGYDLNNNKCISRCGPGKFENKEKDGKCEKCSDENCLVCLLTAENCRKCNKETLLFIKGDENACLDECPMGYFKNTKKRICEKCQDNCKVCANGDSCIACDERFYLFDKKCFKNCPEGYGIIEHSCQKCTDENCAKCLDNDNTKCKKCLAGKFLLWDKCVDPEQCYKHHKYPDKAENKCRRCEGKCKVCLDKKTCLDCYEEFDSKPKSKKISEITGALFPQVISIFDKQFTIPSGDSDNSGNNIDYKECFNACPDNKVMNLDIKSCVCCKDTSCKDCIDKGEKCLSCMGNTSILEGKCLNSCPATYFKDIEKTKCEKCPVGCEDCSNREKCAKCAQGFYLNEDAQCQKYCWDKFYPDPDLRQCIACDASCEVCNSKQNQNCGLCAEGFFKLKSKCVEKSECPKGTYVNLKTRECSKCQVLNCEECSDRKKCNVCTNNYSLSQDAKQCIANLKFFNVIDQPNMYSKYQIENKASKVNQTLTGDFRISCDEPRKFSVSFWTRVITDDIKDGSVLFEVSHPFYEEYLKQNRNLQYSNEQFSYPGFYYNLKINRVEANINNGDNNKITNTTKRNSADPMSEINKEVRKPLKISEFRKLQKLKQLRSLENKSSKDDTNSNTDAPDVYTQKDKSVKYKCVSEIMYLTNQNVIKQSFIENEYCDFLVLKEWTLAILSINLVEDNKLTFKFSMYDSVLQYAYNSTININDKFYFEKEITVISASSFIFLDKQYPLIKVPIFEVSKFQIHEFTLTENDLLDLYKTKPLSCDVNCVRCENDACLQCKNNKVTEDGYCEPTYLPISNNLLELETPQSFILSSLNQHLLYKYISSDRYSFITWFIVNDSQLLGGNQETLLFKLFYYNGINLIEFKLIGSELVLIINGKFEKGQGFELQLGAWYGINISISKDTFYIIIRDEQNEDLINFSQSLDGNQYLMRLTHDTEFYFFGAKTDSTYPESQWAIAKTVIYINNIYLNIPKFSCSANCKKCNKKLECVFCNIGYILSNIIGKGCVLQDNLNPLEQVKRKSLYDFAAEIIEFPDEQALDSITMSCWMRKSLPSRSGTKTTLIGLIEPETEVLYPIMSQEIDEQGVTKYLINLSNIEDKINSRGGLAEKESLIKNRKEQQADRIKDKDELKKDANTNNNQNQNKNLFKKFNQQMNSTLFKNNLELKGNEKTFEYSVKYEDNKFNYIHIGMNFLRHNETGASILTFSLYDSFADKNFTTKLNINSQFSNSTQMFVGDKTKPNVNMAYGPIRFYRGNTLNDPQMYNKILTLTIPKSCEPACKECDYDTGKCLLCMTKKIKSTECETLMYGFTRSINYNITKENQHRNGIGRLNTRMTELEHKLIYNRKFRNSRYASLLAYSDPSSNNEIRRLADNPANQNSPAASNVSSLNRNAIKNDEAFSTSFSELFDMDMTSKVYSVIGWVYILSPPNKGKENIIFRLSNCDYGGIVREDDKNYIYDSGLNLITLKAKYLSSQEKPEFTFVLGDGDSDIEIPTGIEPQKNTWYFISSGKNATAKYFDYSISVNSNKDYANTKRYNLKAVSQPIQEITTLKIFGVNSVSNANSEITKAVVYNLYMIPNVQDANYIMKNYHAKIDPFKPNAFSKCDSSCSECVLDTCIKCKKAYYLFNEQCVKIESSKSFNVMIDQKNVHTKHHKMNVDPFLTVNGSYAFQFYIRRNYHPRFTVLENDNSTLHDKNFDFEANREIVKFGNFKMSFFNRLSGGRVNVDIETPSFTTYRKSNNIITDLSVYQSTDDFEVFEWHFIQVFINRTSIIVAKMDLNKNYTKEEVPLIVIPHNNLVTEDFREINVNGLEDEFSIYGFIFLQSDKYIDKRTLQKPNIDCPIDCTLCDSFPNNICLKCDYGNQCTLNNAKDNLCKFRFISFPSFYLNSLSDQTKNELLAYQGAFRSQNDEESLTALAQNTNNNRKNEYKNLILARAKNSKMSIEEETLRDKTTFAKFFTQTRQDDFSVNYVKFSTLYGHLLNKIVRFRSFTLMFAVSINLSEEYDSIVKILNYDKEKSSNYLSNFAEYEFMNLRFDTIQRLFMFSYSNKNLISNGQEDSSSYTIKGYSNKGNLNQYHYIAISYNEVQRLFSFVILNSKDNYIVDNVTTNGDMDYLGVYTNIIFGDGFKKKNKGKDAESKVFEVKFMHETALNTLELINELQKNYDLMSLHGCTKIDIRTNKCLNCDEGLTNKKGICLENTAKNIEVYRPTQIVENYFSIEDDILLEYQATESNPPTKFTIQFMFLKIENTYKLNGLLKFSKIPSVATDRARNLITILERENGLIFALSLFSDPDKLVYFFVDNIYKLNQNYSWVQITVGVNLSTKSFNVYIYDYKAFEISINRFDYIKQFEKFEKNKDFNPMKKTEDEKFGFRFSFKGESFTIASQDRNLILNESAENDLVYRMSTFVFFTDAEVMAAQLKRIVPLRPIACVCACKCINDICPINCQFEEFWIKYDPEKNVIDKSLLFQNFFKILENNSVEYAKKFPEKAKSLDFSDKRRLMLSNYFKKASISFKLDFKKYLYHLNTWSNILFKIPYFIKYMNKNHNLKKYLPALEESKKNQKDGQYNFSYNEITLEFGKVLSKAFSSKHFSDKIRKYVDDNKLFMLDNGFNGRNIKNIFCLTDDIETGKINQGDEITNQMVKDSILTMQASLTSLKVSVGSNKFSDSVYTQELDFQNKNTVERSHDEDLLKIDQIYVYIHIDMTKNFLKVILFLNDMRKDFDFHFSHKTGYISFFSSIFVNPSVDDLVINVGETFITKHLGIIRKKIVETQFSHKFCEKSCKDCFVGSQKHLRKCMICGEGQSMYNNLCMKSKNVALNPILRHIQQNGSSSDNKSYLSKNKK